MVLGKVGERCLPVSLVVTPHHGLAVLPPWANRLPSPQSDPRKTPTKAACPSADRTRLTAITTAPTSPQSTVWRWRDRVLSEGVDGLLHDATRPPGRKPIPAATVQAIIDLAMAPPPPNRSHWTPGV